MNVVSPRAKKLPPRPSAFSGFWRLVSEEFFKNVDFNGLLQTAWKQKYRPVSAARLFRAASIVAAPHPKVKMQS